VDAERAGKAAFGGHLDIVQAAWPHLTPEDKTSVYNWGQQGGHMDVVKELPFGDVKVGRGKMVSFGQASMLLCCNKG